MEVQDIKNIIGKPFRYKSKYGGIVDGIIEYIIHTKKVEGYGDFKLVNTSKSTIPLHEKYNVEIEYCIKSTNGIIYNLNDIEIL